MKNSRVDFSNGPDSEGLSRWLSMIGSTMVTSGKSELPKNVATSLSTIVMLYASSSYSVQSFDLAERMRFAIGGLKRQGVQVV